MADCEDVDISQYLAPRDHQEFDGISYNFTKGDQLPEYGRGKVLNRYGDILPHPKTRVKLQVQNGDIATEYINANFVRSFNSETTGYIAAQGPTARTLPDFVRMLWEQDVKVCVMLTKLKEGTKAKCEPYFPARLDSSMTFGDIVVKLLSSSQKDGHIRNLLQLKHTPSGKTKDVAQFWYINWPDHGVPEKDGEPFTREMILLVLTVRSYRRKTDKMMSPAVIHCSAGVGRTGAYIAIDQAIDAYKQKQIIDINAIVRRMREDRMALIQHTNQYKFAWAAAADYVIGKVQLNKNKKPRVSVGGQSPVRAAKEEFFIMTELFSNPDGNEGVLITEVGEKLKLIDKSDTWWWMAKADGSEGWALAAIMVPEAEYKPVESEPQHAANPFGNGPNPFAKSNKNEKKPVAMRRTASNPFDLKAQTGGARPRVITSYNPNPFEEPLQEEDDDVVDKGTNVSSELYDAASGDGSDEVNDNPFESYLQSRPSTDEKEKDAANPFVQAEIEKEAANPFAGATAPANGPAASRPRASSQAEEPNPFAATKATSVPSMTKEEKRKSNPFDKQAKPRAAKRGVPGMDAMGEMDDMMASMLGGINDLDSRIASLKSNERNVDVEDELPPDPVASRVDDDEQSEPVGSPDPQNAFYSDLQPFTYVDANGSVGTLFNADLSTYSAPAHLDKNRLRSPSEILGPAVVSHDFTWRCTDNASIFAAELSAGRSSDTEC